MIFIMILTLTLLVVDDNADAGDSGQSVAKSNEEAELWRTARRTDQLIGKIGQIGLIYCTTIIWPRLMVTLMQMKKGVNKLYRSFLYFTGHTVIIHKQIQRLEKLL